mmetsp:Transcript_33890/g.80739  ORF Transcript_33890/g.80739 Transcript_33890/m.80739 type:complete len:225 (+) Transcript_33890:334-1008(+)
MLHDRGHRTRRHACCPLRHHPTRLLQHRPVRVRGPLDPQLSAQHLCHRLPIHGRLFAVEGCHELGGKLSRRNALRNSRQRPPPIRHRVEKQCSELPHVHSADDFLEDLLSGVEGGSVHCSVAWRDGEVSSRGFKGAEVAPLHVDAHLPRGHGSSFPLANLLDLLHVAGVGPGAEDHSNRRLRLLGCDGHQRSDSVVRERVDNHVHVLLLQSFLQQRHNVCAFDP